MGDINEEYLRKIQEMEKQREAHVRRYAEGQYSRTNPPNYRQNCIKKIGLPAIPKNFAISTRLVSQNVGCLRIRSSRNYPSSFSLVQHIRQRILSTAYRDD